jgi:predicted nucleic-acid-binding protein
MIAVDTNVVVRLLVEDDVEQTRHSTQLFETNEIYLCDSVVLETGWVLRHIFGYTPSAIAAALKKVFGLPNVRLRDSHAIQLALEWHEQGLDFADAFHLAQANECTHLVTFDRSFAKRAATVSDREVLLLG